MIKPNLRTFIVLAHDVLATAIAWLAAYWLRFNLDIPAEFLQPALVSVFWVVPFYVAVFLGTGLYRGIWRYASLNDLRRILLAVALAAVITAAATLMLGVQQVPRSVLILHPMLLVLVMGGSRFTYRAWKEYRLYGALRFEGKPVLVLGAGDAAVMLLRELERSRDWRVVGLLDDDTEKHGRQVNTVHVLGPIAQLNEWAKKLDVEYAILAMPAAAASVRRQVIDTAARAGIATLTVPAMDDLLSGRVSISQIRKIELEDLLGREQVILDEDGLREFLGGKTVLITGAGGSIGAELARQIARFKPRRLVFYELSEFALYRIEQEFAESFGAIPIACLAGDVKDAVRLDAVFAQYQPQVVFHAAAYKHVPLMEDDNAWEAVRNNVAGTLCVACAARAHETEKFVLISTDKAVNPTNVMGATKRLAEMVSQAILSRDAAKPNCVIVRFGNVLGSNGSVIPKFNEQIAKGGPLTVTHPEITRYFMSIPEAAQLVLQAGMMGGKGHASGEIFVLDMGEPVKIAGLARDMIRLSGFSEDEIRIEFTGLRPGEKLYEEPLADDEQTLPTPHPKLRIARASECPDQAWLEALLRWLATSPATQPDATKRELARWVTEYQPQLAAQPDAATTHN